MDIRAIRTKLDYRRTLKEIETLMDATPNSPKGERLDVLVALVESYERKHHALDLPDPVEAIKFRMEQMGLAPKDLEPMIGRRNRVYEVLNRKRPLTMKMAWNLHCELGIPAESLIRPPADFRAAWRKSIRGSIDVPRVLRHLPDRFRTELHRAPLARHRHHPGPSLFPDQVSTKLWEAHLPNHQKWKGAPSAPFTCSQPLPTSSLFHRREVENLVHSHFVSR